MNHYFNRREQVRWSLFSDLLGKIINAGLNEKQSDATIRNIVISNTVAVIFFTSTLIVSFFIMLAEEYMQKVAGLFLLLPVMFCFPVLFNALGWTKLSRIILSCLPSTAVVMLSIITKLRAEDITFNDYYNFRIGLIAFCSIPFLLFSLKEIWGLSLTTLVCILCLVLSDQLHHLFNIGFYDIGFTDTHYSFINFTSAVASLSIMMAILSLKSIIETQEVANQKLLSHLQSGNEEIKMQRDELMAQSEHLNQNQFSLNLAYQVIETQKKMLEEELTLYDYEITQFSYNVAHHLRGPVASLSGLVNLLLIEGDKEALFPHFQRGLMHLESVVADLKHVLDIRKDFLRVKSDLCLETIFGDVMKSLTKELDAVNPEMKTDFTKAPAVYSSPSSMSSILFNLISNAIKFKRETEPLCIEISSYLDNETSNLVLKIKDNGLGIDLNTFKEDIFKMYKRFHLHTEGKGLGLYLVKLQTIAMGGTIEVDSRVNEFTTFTVRIPLSNNADGTTKNNFSQPQFQ